MNKIILYCRPGFETECAKEINDKATKYKFFGFAHVKKYSGYVIFECYQSENATKLIRKLPFSSLIYARQMFISSDLLKNLSPKDRITPIIVQLQKNIKECSDLRVEVADTNENRKLMKFCNKFIVPLRATLRNIGILRDCYVRSKQQSVKVIHVFFIAPNCCYVGYSLSSNNSPFQMGIPRLKFPTDAPSRSSLKLEEAFHVFIPSNEWDKRLAHGMYAIDLGACPGGWTYQLVKRNMSVYSVDNGHISQSLINTGQVIWLRENGFCFRPSCNNIYWLVCDIVEKPARITSLIIKWLLNGWCHETIFNLKLPMKKRYEEIMKNLSYIQQQMNIHSVKVEIQARQLYHDREEITVHIRRHLSL